MFVPLTHPPGDAQADFGEAIVVIGGVEQKAFDGLTRRHWRHGSVSLFVMDLPHSDACFVRAYLPCDVSVSLDGVFAALPPHPASALTSPVLAVRHLPLGQCRRIRNGAAEAEVCPALWRADHLVIVDATLAPAEAVPPVQAA